MDPITSKEYETQAPSDSFSQLSDVTTFLEEKAQVLELLHASKEQKGNVPNSFKNSHQGNQRPTQLNAYITTSGRCVFCESNHSLHKCESFRKATTSQRYAFVKKKRLCFNCLGQHNVRSCKSGDCRLCHRRHHTLLHFDTSSTQGINNNVSIADNKDNHGHNNSSYCALKFKRNSQVLLSTAVVQVVDSQGRSHKCRALLDNGSQSNFITERLANILKIKRNKNSIPISGINNTDVTISQSVNVCIKSCVSDFQANITCSILPHITGNIPATYIDNSS